MIYSSLILPYLNYCVELWGNTYATNLRSIIFLQKKGIRLIAYVDYYSPSSPLFIKYKLLKSVDIVKLNTGVIMYKAFHCLLNSRLTSYFTVYRSATRQNLIFFVKYQRTKQTSLSISCIGVKLWNGLYPELKKSHSITVFKSRFKKIATEFIQ